MRKTTFDPSMDMNAFASILALAPKKTDEVQGALQSVRHLGGEWVEKTRDGSQMDEWDPWSAAN